MSDSAVASALAEKYLRLHLCQDVGPIRFTNLLREIGSIDQVLGASHTRLMGVSRVGPKVAENIVRGRDKNDVQSELELAARHGVRILCLDDDDYPALLRQIDDPPVCLYVRGSVQRQDALALGIVGSRFCSRYGAEQAERFGALAASAGLAVVSGFARGIDAAAHRGAVIGGGRTLAVLGCGLCHLYPPDAEDLAAQIIASGALLSELPMQSAPDAKNFPARNRIIAGLSLGVLVIEAAARSGALITARQATEYNREVFALPGRADISTAEGCNRLIQKGEAKLVTQMGDILDELGEAGRHLKVAATPRLDGPEPPSGFVIPFDDVETQILTTLQNAELDMDSICQETGLTPSRVAVAMTGLQLKGAVQNGAAGTYRARTSLKNKS